MALTETKPDKTFWLGALRREAGALRAVMDDGTLPTALPSCPGWTLDELARHTGAGFRWIAEHVVRGVTTSPGYPSRDSAPTGPAVLPWWDESLELLLVALDRVDPELPAWNPCPRPKVAAFWPRREAHEIAVHRWDGQVAIGLPEPIETDLAVDGVAEVFDSMLPADPPKQPVGDGVIQLVATDAEDGWIIRVRGTAISLLDTATLVPEEHQLRTQASGTASDLMLALWGRVPFDVLEITGEASLLEALRVGGDD
jgi:uncharacterized protein (TIGR03083 family)